MKKALLFITVILLLCGCASEGRVDQVVRKTLHESVKKNAIPTTNMNKRYYDYYLPGEVGKKTSTMLSEIFSKNDRFMIMNFNASAIVVDQFYLKDEENKQTTEKKSSLTLKNPTKKQLTKLTYQLDKHKVMNYKGIYQNQNKYFYPYTLQLQKAENNQYFIHINGTIVDFYSNVAMADIEPTVRTMMKIMQSIKFDKDKILKDFSLKKANEHQRDNLNYVNGVYAEEGFLIDQEYRETQSPK